MSLQPLITSAFSTIYTPPGPYGARRSPTVGDAPVWTARRAEEAAAVSATRWADQTNEVGSPPDVRTVQPARDAGKPMSASGDLLDLSNEAKKLSAAPANDAKITVQQQDESTVKETEKPSSDVLQSTELTPEEQQKVSEMRTRDAEVRTHEAAHLAAAGPYATSGASYTYETGPDGKKYAVGGEVSISTGPVKGDPEATLEKAQTIQRAALAPAQPSDQDRKVAAAAAQMAAQARQEIAQQKTTQSQESEETRETEQAGAAFQLIHEAVNSAATKQAASPAASYAAQSVMASRPGNFSVYA